MYKLSYCIFCLLIMNNFAHQEELSITDEMEKRVKIIQNDESREKFNWCTTQEMNKNLPEKVLQNIKKKIVLKLKEILKVKST